MGANLKRKTGSSLEDVQDSCFSWVILAAASIGMGILIGFVRSFGVFLKELQSTFGSSSSATSLVSSLGSFISLIFALPASQLNDRYGPRVVVMCAGLLLASAFVLSSLATSIYFMYASFSLLFGLGTAATFTPLIVIVGRYFTRHRAVANALLMCGSCIGSFALPILIDYLLNFYGLSSTFLLCGAIALHLSLCGSILRQPIVAAAAITTNECDTDEQQTVFHVENGGNQCPNNDTKVLPEPQSQNGAMTFWKVSLKLMCNGQFMLYALAEAVLMMSYPVLFISLPSYAMQLGYTQTYAVRNFLTVVTICDLTARLCCVLLGVLNSRRSASTNGVRVPFLSDKLFCVSLFLTGCGWALLASLVDFVAVSSACGLIAVGFGLSLATFPVVLAHVLGGTQQLAAAHGLAMLLQAPLYLGMPVVAGFARDYIGTWTWAYAVCAGAILLVALLVSALLVWQCSCRSRNVPDPDPDNHNHNLDQDGVNSR